MGIGAYMLAGGLQGLGAGITQKAESDVAERRAVALENLRASNQREQTRFGGEVARQNATEQARLNDTLAERNAGRGLAKDLALIPVKTAAQLQVDNNRIAGQGANDAASDARDRSTRMDVENLRSSNAITEEERKSALRTIEAGEKPDWKVSASGQIVGLKANGEVVTPQVTRVSDGRRLYLRGARPDDSGGQDSGAGGATIGGARAARSGGASPVAAQTTPERRIAETPAPASGARGIGGRVANPFDQGAGETRPLTPEEVFKIGQDTSDVAVFKNAGKATYTMADLRYSAEQAGITLEEARRRATARGMVLTR